MILSHPITPRPLAEAGMLAILGGGLAHLLPTLAVVIPFIFYTMLVYDKIIVYWKQWKARK